MSRESIRHADWFLAEWLEVHSKRQVDLVKDLGWNRAKASMMLRGRQQYNREAVNELADYLAIEPFELLLHPEEAKTIRKLRDMPDDTSIDPKR